MQTVRYARRSRPAPVLLGTVATGLTLALALAGCSASDSDSAGDAGADVDSQERGAAGPGEPDAVEPAEPGEPGGEAGGAILQVRDIIYTGEITVRVEDVDEAATGATALAGRYDGFVGGDRRSTGGDHTHATLELRIPSEDFTSAVDALGDLGKEESREIDTEDVTEEVVDLQTRIATAQASVDRTRELLERADSISDIVSVEEELTEREARLASLQARQRELADQTALSTITAHLLGPRSPGVTDDGPDLGFLPGLRAGWDAFVSSMTVLVTVLGALLPWLIAAGIPAGAAIWWVRRRRTPAPPSIEEGTPPGAQA